MSSTTTRPGRDIPRPMATGHHRLWAVLRLHRSAMWIWIAFVVVTTAVMLWLRYGPYGTGAAETQAGCGTPGHRPCSSIPNTSYDLFTFWVRLDHLSSLLREYLAPVVAGWAGAALIARELENGTAELAWTQSITPARWFMEKLAVPAAFLTAGTGLLVAHIRTLLDWADAHNVLGAGYQIQDYYFAYGPSVVAHVLLGLAVGVLAGFVTRAVLPALGIASLTTWTVSWLINPWRTQIWPVVTRTEKGEGPYGFAALRCQWDQSDHKYWVDACLGAKKASLYWPVQLVETGFVLLLAALAATAAYWLLRRRTP